MVAAKARMDFIINSYNTVGLGPSVISRRMLFTWRNAEKSSALVLLPDLPAFEDLSSDSTLRIWRIPARPLWLRYLLRLFLDTLIQPFLTLLFRPKATIVMANYAPVPFVGRKVVLMRHPYLIDSCEDHQLPRSRALLEFVRRISFFFTTRSSSAVIVQSPLMRAMLEQKVGPINCPVAVLPNPATADAFGSLSPEPVELPQSRFLLYPSRFYLHKNHDFLLQLVQEKQRELRARNLAICITVNGRADPGAEALLERISKLEVADTLVNLGELHPQQLLFCYQRALGVIFVSRAETFGNSLVEAMSLGVPVLAADRPYAWEICGDAALYFDTKRCDDALTKIDLMLSEERIREELISAGRERAAQFPTVEQWLQRLLNIAEGVPPT